MPPARPGLDVRDLPLGRGLYAAIAMQNAARLRPQVFPTDRSGIERLLARRLPPRRHAG